MKQERTITLKIFVNAHENQSLRLAEELQLAAKDVLKSKGIPSGVNVSVHNG